MPKELVSLFESYRDGWNALSGDAIASHYRLPATVSDMDGLQSFLHLRDLGEKFQANCDYYRELGYESACFSVGTCILSGEESATVDLGWRVRLNSAEIEFRSTYMCARVNGGWSILSAVAYDGAYTPPTAAQ